jgi:hypothetical protein
MTGNKRMEKNTKKEKEKSGIRLLKTTKDKRTRQIETQGENVRAEMKVQLMVGWMNTSLRGARLARSRHT